MLAGWLLAFCVLLIMSLTLVLLTFLFYFIFFLFLGRLLVLYFSLVAPALCYLFLHVVLYVFLENK